MASVAAVSAAPASRETNIERQSFLREAFAPRTRAEKRGVLGGLVIGVTASLSFLLSVSHDTKTTVDHMLMPDGQFVWEVETVSVQPTLPEELGLVITAGAGAALGGEFVASIADIIRRRREEATSMVA